MTVTELLDGLLKLYHAATPEALKVMKAAFYGRLRKHEGEGLQHAFDEVVATFKATKAQGFPLPIDFERFLKPELNIGSSHGPALDLKGYHERRRAMLAEWWEAQGNGIRQQRGAIIARACWLEVMLRLSVEAWAEDAPNCRLSKEAIELAEQRVVSSYRLQVYGAAILETDNADEWRRQMAEIRAMLYRGETPNTPGLKSEVGQTLKPLHVKRPVNPNAKGLPPEHMAPKPEDEFAELDK